MDNHSQRLLTHIRLVQEETIKLIESITHNDIVVDIKRLLANSLIHDNSKFYGIEWEYLRNDVEPKLKQLAIDQHINNNPHHPEYWGGIDNMPGLYIFEMVADWSAMSREFRNNLLDWFLENQPIKFPIESTARKEFITSLILNIVEKSNVRS